LYPLHGKRLADIREALKAKQEEREQRVERG